MNEIEIKAVVTGNGISKNKRKYDLKTVQESFDRYIQLHEEEIREAINYYDLTGYDKKLKDLGIYAIQQRHISKSSWSLIGIGINYTLKELTDVYRKFIEENKYGRITSPDRSIPIPRVKCTKSNGNNIKYDSRRLFDDLGK